MGKKPSNNNKKELVNVEVATLKRNLNSVYQSRKKNKAILSHDGLFEYLWDLKELALMEGKTSVEVPSAWVDELDSNLEHSKPS